MSNITDTDTTIENNNSKTSSASYMDNYLTFRAKLEVHPQFDKEAVARIKRSCERMMQNRPKLFQKIFSGDPEQLQQVKSEVNARMSELKQKRLGLDPVVV